MARKARAKPNGEVLADAKETAAIEQYWHLAGRPQPRKPPKNYKYVEELAHLGVELIKLQEWVRRHGLKVDVIFEGRDAAGKGGVIKRIAESLNPRVCRIVALVRQPNGNAANGISNATFLICLRRERSCSSTAVGTTAPVWST